MVTLRIPKTFVTYLTGMFTGAFLGTSIVLAADHAYRTAGVMVAFAVLVAIAWALQSWYWRGTTW